VPGLSVQHQFKKEWTTRTVVANMSRTVFVFFVILISPVFPVWSTTDAENSKDAKIYEIRRLAEDESIKVDGLLTEPAWQRADVGRDFVQQVPQEGELATQKTEVRLLYDQRNIYVGIRCWQSDKIVVTDMHRDFAVLDNDIIEVIFDSFHDRTGGFDFATNPSGALFDVQWSGDGTEANTNWNAVWDVRTHVYGDSWTAEFIIPFKTLRFTNSEKQEWGLNFRRAARYINEGSCWSPIPRRFKLGTVSLAGTMTGIENVQPGRNLKIKPFILGSATRLPSRQGKPDFYLGKVGLDLKYGLTKGLTLDFTANTDFSQVEADV
jgi:hypothetical protein